MAVHERWLVTVGLSLVASAALGDEQRLHLLPGGTARLELPHDAALNVSRRGVVDLHQTAEDQWQITALHAGIVLIEARGPGTGPADATRYLVEVASADDARKAGKAARGDVPDWLCAPPAVACDRATGIVSGTAPGWGWLLQAAQACQPGRGCLLLTGLDDAARTAWKEALAPFSDPANTAVSPAGFVQFLAPCGDEGEAALAKVHAPFPELLVPKARLAVRCAPEAPDPGYELTARVFLVDESAARTLGFNGLLDVSAGVGDAAIVPAPGAHLGLLTRLEALAEEHRATVVGEPKVRLLPGRPVTIRAGGEFQVTEFRDERLGPAETDQQTRHSAAASWKQTGLEMTVRALPLATGGARLNFEAALKLKTRSGAEPALTVGSVQSALDLALGEPQLAAVLDLSTRAEGSAETPWAGRIPLIGPLFRREGRESAKARLVLWLTLARPAAGGDQRSKLK